VKVDVGQSKVDIAGELEVFLMQLRRFRKRIVVLLVKLGLIAIPFGFIQMVLSLSGKLLRFVKKYAVLAGFGILLRDLSFPAEFIRSFLIGLQLPFRRLLEVSGTIRQVFDTSIETNGLGPIDTLALGIDFDEIVERSHPLCRIDQGDSGCVGPLIGGLLHNGSGLRWRLQDSERYKSGKNCPPRQSWQS
jgi:hypothetical protein